MQADAGIYTGQQSDIRGFYNFMQIYAGPCRLMPASKICRPAARYLQASPAFKLQAWPAYASGGREIEAGPVRNTDHMVCRCPRRESHCDRTMSS